MFTGITQEIGSVKEVKTCKGLTRVSIASHKVIGKARAGSSVLVDGICSTMIKKGHGWFTVEYMPETKRRTTVERWKKGTLVNLEPSMRFGDEMAGHLVSGHIDCVGSVRNISRTRSETVADIQIPQTLARFFVDKGSVAVNGISLTIVKPRGNRLTAALIPYTLTHTNLGLLKKYDTVNVEVDIMAKYLYKLKTQSSKSRLRSKDEYGYKEVSRGKTRTHH